MTARRKDAAPRIFRHAWGLIPLLFGIPASHSAVSAGGLCGPGRLVPAESPTVLAIDGDGFFLVRREADHAYFLTRVGNFHPDENGYLVTSDRRLQGVLDEAGTERGDIRIDNARPPAGADPAATIASFEIAADGTIWIRLTDGTRYPRAQVQLYPGFDCQGLLREDQGVFLLAPPEAPTQMGAPGTTGRGVIRTSTREVLAIPPAFLSEVGIFQWYWQGPLHRTTNAGDVAIAGPGFFQVRDPATGAFFLTRTGSFRRDPNGWLVDDGGFRLQGWSNATITAQGDLRIDGEDRPATSDPAAALTGWAWGDDGTVRVRLGDGTEYVRGQVALAEVGRPGWLEWSGGYRFSTTKAAQVNPALRPPGESGVGRLTSPALESLRRPGDESVLLFFVGQPGAQFVVEASDDLHSWTELARVVGSNEYRGQFEDPIGARRQRFYRLRPAD